MFTPVISPLDLFGLLSRKDPLHAAFIIAKAEKPVSSRTLRDRFHNRADRTVRWWLECFFNADLVHRRYCHRLGGYQYLPKEKLEKLLRLVGVSVTTFRPSDPLQWQPINDADDRYRVEPPDAYRD